MGQIMIPTCDVFGTRRGIRKERIIRELLDENGEWVELDRRMLELSPRGSIRLTALIDRGCSPPTQHKHETKAVDTPSLTIAKVEE